MTDALAPRPWRADDLEAARTILLASEPWITLGYTHDHWGRYLGALEGDASRQAVVADDHGRVAAFAIVRQGFLAGDYLQLIAVAPEARGRGVGRALMEHLEGVAFARSRNFFLCVSDFNAPARAFYARLGYVEVGPMPDLLVQGHAEILMRKTTGPARG